MFFAIIALGSYVGSYLFLSSLESRTPEVIEIPNPNVPPIASSSADTSSSSSSKMKNILPLMSEYMPSQSPFREEEYSKAPRILFKGEFLDVVAKINGKVESTNRSIKIFALSQPKSK